MRNNFDLEPGFIYLNSGTHSISPRSVMDGIQRHARRFNFNPTMELESVCGKMWNVQKKIASFFQANPEDLYLRANVTEPLNEFLLQMPLSPGAEILTSNAEYGAIANILKFRADRDGFTIKTFNIPEREKIDNWTDQSLIDEILRHVSTKTQAVMISHVVTSTGLVFPIQKIAQEMKKRKINFIVDGAHGPGALDVDFQKLKDVTFYAGNLHKWMLGPKGTAFAWTNPSAQNWLKPLMIGWTSFGFEEPFLEFGENNPFTYRMFLLGCRDFAPFLALDETIQFWIDHKPEKIRAKIKELREIVQQKNLFPGEIYSFEKMQEQSPLTAFELPEKFQRYSWLKIMREILHEHGVQVGLPYFNGKMHLRISPHIYNTEEEIIRAAEKLRLFVGGKS